VSRFRYAPPLEETPHEWLDLEAYRHFFLTRSAPFGWANPMPGTPPGANHGAHLLHWQSLRRRAPSLRGSSVGIMICRR